jgi:hypothetical protein
MFGWIKRIREWNAEIDRELEEFNQELQQVWKDLEDLRTPKNRTERRHPD